MKKYFLMLGIWFVVILGIIAGSAVYNHYKSSRYDESAHIFLKKTVPQLSNWDVDQIRLLMAPEALERISDTTYNATITLFAKMGRLLSFDKPKFSQIHLEDKDRAIVEYTIDAKYENGDAILTVNLLHEDGEFKIYHFNVQSSALTN
ncbi:MAG: hypothetical protein JRE16_00575 [Deltaproteobacteria bacterium]|nr:hypothetical protein [Deltaproteobacteria bacterium]